LHRVVFGRKSQVECLLGYPEYGFHMSHEIAIRRTEILASHEGCHWSRATNPLNSGWMWPGPKSRLADRSPLRRSDEPGDGSRSPLVPGRRRGYIAGSPDGGTEPFFRQYGNRRGLTAPLAALRSLEKTMKIGRMPCRIATITLITTIAIHQSGKAAQQPCDKGAGVKAGFCETMIPGPRQKERAKSQSGCPAYMAPCVDDDERAPATMPYADDAAIAPPTVRWKGWRRMPNDYSGCEESEAGGSVHRADCREDPAYPYQYPGCPYIGPSATPGVYHRLPAMPRELPPPEIYRSPHGTPAPTAPGTLPGKKSANDAECPAHPEVDTMEFRRSDAKEGEFDRTPFNRPY
jgi:hypothetical protein